MPCHAKLVRNLSVLFLQNEEPLNMNIAVLSQGLLSRIVGLMAVRL